MRNTVLCRRSSTMWRSPLAPTGLLSLAAPLVDAAHYRPGWPHRVTVAEGRRNHSSDTAAGPLDPVPVSRRLRIPNLVGVDASQKPSFQQQPTLRKVGNIFVVRFIDHYFKHGAEVGRALRDLRFEFKGQTTIHPDTPAVRKNLFVARHCVAIDVMDLDEAKSLLGVPPHVEFRDLARQLETNSHVGPITENKFMASKLAFSQRRRARLHDILQRDAIEKRRLAYRKQLKEAQQTSRPPVTRRDSGTA